MSRAKKMITDMDMLTAKAPDLEPGPDKKAPMREAIKSVLRKIKEAEADILGCSKKLEEGDKVTLDACKDRLQEAIEEVEKYEEG